MNYLWNPDEVDQLIEMWRAGEKITVIAATIGRTERGVADKKRMLMRAGVLSRRNNFMRWDGESDVKLMDFWQAGWMGAEIASAMGLSARQIHSRLKRLRISLPRESAPAYRQRTPKRVVSFAEVRAAVLQKYRMTMEDISSHRRERKFVEPRQVLMAVSYQYTGLSLPQIGSRCRRDHTTVLHAIRTAPLKYPEAFRAVASGLLRDAAE